MDQWFSESRCRHTVGVRRSQEGGLRTLGSLRQIAAARNCWREIVDELQESASLRMILIPAGIVALRDDRTQRRWDVELQAYSLGAAPVTQALYAAITGNWPSSHGDAGCLSSVSWLDAVSFCNQLSRKQGLTRPMSSMTTFKVLISSPRPTVCAFLAGRWERRLPRGTLGPRYGPPLHRRPG